MTEMERSDPDPAPAAGGTSGVPARAPADASAEAPAETPAGAPDASSGAPSDVSPAALSGTQAHAPADAAANPRAAWPADAPAGRPTSAWARAIGGRGKGRAGSGAYLYGVVRSVGRRGAKWVRGFGEDLLRVRYRDLVALARAMPYHAPVLDRPEIVEHQRLVERVMRRGTILPAPPGVVFRGRRPLVRFLEDQYLALEEGLIFIDGHWELRLHMTSLAVGADDEELDRIAARTYAELRRFARAAVPFPRRGRRVLSAAFLVERGAWIDFVERAEEVGAAHAELMVDVTGPWPPYDFVRIVF